MKVIKQIAGDDTMKRALKSIGVFFIVLIVLSIITGGAESLFPVIASLIAGIGFFVLTRPVNMSKMSHEDIITIAEDKLKRAIIAAHKRELNTCPYCNSKIYKDAVSGTKPYRNAYCSKNNGEGCGEWITVWSKS